MGATASNGAPTRGRPLSPHMSIYRMSRYCLLTSISNRITGGLTTLGLPLLAYWLVTLASGERTYARAQPALAHPALQAFYALLLLAFSYHLLAGIRHLIWDTGCGLDKTSIEIFAWGTIIGSTALTLLLWLVGYWLRSAA